jgi:hypothetical protein
MKGVFTAAMSILIAGPVVASSTIALTHLRGNVYVVQEDYPLSDENAAVFGHRFTDLSSSMSICSSWRLTKSIQQRSRILGNPSIQ